jgi:hypothetical protein
MEVIFSYLSFNDHFFCNIEMAKASNFLAKKFGYKTCLYTDKNGFEILNKHIDYDNVILFNEEILQKLPNKIWSIGKILAMSMIDKPFMHFDFDLFILKEVDQKILNNDFFVLHEEPWVNSSYVDNKEIRKIYNLYPNKNEISDQIVSYNYGIVGGQKFHEIKTVCKKIIDFSIGYKNEINIMNNKTLPTWLYAVLFEQILITNLLNKIYNINPYDICETFPLKWDDNDEEVKNLFKIRLKKSMVKNKILHLHGDKDIKLELIKKLKII